MKTSLQRRFALMPWERYEAWLLVRSLLTLAMVLLRLTRLLQRSDAVSVVSVERMIDISGELQRRSQVVWGAFLQRREALRADAEAAVGQKTRPPWTPPR